MSWAVLYGAEAEADSMFTAVEQNYMQLKRRAQEAPLGKTLLMNKLTSAVWYVPAGGSTIGSIIADAHAGYAFAGDKSSGSLALPFETVLEKSRQCRGKAIGITVLRIVVDRNGMYSVGQLVGMLIFADDHYRTQRQQSPDDHVVDIIGNQLLTLRRAHDCIIDDAGRTILLQQIDDDVERGKRANRKT